MLIKSNAPLTLDKSNIKLNIISDIGSFKYKGIELKPEEMRVICRDLNIDVIDMIDNIKKGLYSNNTLKAVDYINKIREFKC